MENGGEKAPAWLDLKLSLGNILMVVTAIFGFGAYSSSVNGRLASLQASQERMASQMQELINQAERRDVAESQRQALIDRVSRLERKVDRLQ